jgi:predicted transposase/invertase (TIGR01784 family)
LKIYRDLKNSIDTAFEEGKLEGIIEGERKEKIASAKNMKLRDLSVEDIAAMTGLAVEEIRGL